MLLPVLVKQSLHGLHLKQLLNAERFAVDMDIQLIVGYLVFIMGKKSTQHGKEITICFCSKQPSIFSKY